MSAYVCMSAVAGLLNTRPEQSSETVKNDTCQRAMLCPGVEPMPWGVARRHNLDMQKVLLSTVMIFAEQMADQSSDTVAKNTHAPVQCFVWTRTDDLVVWHAGNLDKQKVLLSTVTNLLNKGLKVVMNDVLKHTVGFATNPGA
jgi:hypothetical protein